MYMYENLMQMYNYIVCVLFYTKSKSHYIIFISISLNENGIVVNTLSSYRAPLF